MFGHGSCQERPATSSWPIPSLLQAKSASPAERESGSGSESESECESGSERKSERESEKESESKSENESDTERRRMRTFAALTLRAGAGYHSQCPPARASLRQEILARPPAASSAWSGEAPHRHPNLPPPEHNRQHCQTIMVGARQQGRLAPLP